MVAFEEGIASLAFSPDGNLLAVGPSFTEKETSIKLFSSLTGEETGRLRGHTSWIPGLAFTPDGKRLVSAGADQTVRIWDLENRREPVLLRGHRSEVNCVSVSADGKTIVTGCKDGTLFLWDAESGRRRNPVEILARPAAQVEFSPAGKDILTLGSEGSITLWDAATLRESGRFGLPRGRADSFLVSSTGDRLCVSSRGGEVTVLDWPGGSTITNLNLNLNLGSFINRRPGVTLLGLMDQDRTLVTTAPDAAIRLWDTGSWQLKAEFALRHGPGQLPFWGQFAL
jgi:WD40 repeat protein